MTDTPERIFIDPDIPPSEWDKQYLDDVTYIREDVHLAEVAAAYEAAGHWLWSHPDQPMADLPDYAQHRAVLAKSIRALTPTDARAALDRLLDEARREAFEVVGLEGLARLNPELAEKIHGKLDDYLEE